MTSNPFRAPKPARERTGLSQKNYDALIDGIARIIKHEVDPLKERIEELEARPTVDVDKHITALERQISEFEGVEP